MENRIEKVSIYGGVLLSTKCELLKEDVEGTTKIMRSENEIVKTLTLVKFSDCGEFL